MISRYEQKDMSEIWGLQAKYELFLKIEKLLAKELEEQEVLPKGMSKSLESSIVNLERINELERTLKHDVLAFTTSIEEQLDFSYQKYFHYGVTSSDIIDTALMLQIKSSFSLLKADIISLLNVIEKQITKTSDLICLGRTHGVSAEPMIFAQKWLSFQEELKRVLKSINELNFTGSISGAIGTYTFLDLEIENTVLQKLGLTPEIISTQVIPRDRFLTFIQTLISLSAFVERVCVELRHLQHSDINEVYEGFSDGQKGSSIMPHKKNPISSENLTGISRIIYSFHNVAYSNCTLWHERDLSHSSSERIMFPDIFGLSSYAVRRLTRTINSLVYNRENIERKIFRSPSIFSSRILHKAINKSSKNRREIYQIIQKSFFEHSNLDDVLESIERSLNVSLDFEITHIKKQIINQFAQKLEQTKRIQS